MSMFQDANPATLHAELRSLGFTPVEANTLIERLRTQRRHEADAPSDQWPVAAFQGSDAAEFGPRLAKIDEDESWSDDARPVIEERRIQAARFEHYLASKEAQRQTAMALAGLAEIRSMGGGGAA